LPSIIDIAICIRTWDYSETSQTASLFSREHGIIRGLAKGARRPRSRFSGGFEVLARGQMIAIVRRGAELAIISEWDLHEVCWAMRRRLAAYQAGMYIADLVHHTVTDHDPHPELFDALERAMSELADEEQTPVTLLRFQLDLLTAIGYAPEFNGDDGDGRSVQRPLSGTVAFMPDGGRLTQDTGAQDRWRVRAETVEALRDLQRHQRTPLIATPGGRATVERANRLLAAYIRHVVGKEPPTMQVVFPSLRIP